MKKRIVVLIAAFAILVPVCGINMIYNNYRLGSDLYAAACSMSVETARLDRSITFLKKEFAKGADNEAYRERHVFDNDIHGIRISLAYNRTLLLDEVRVELGDRIEDFYQETKSDEGLKNYFATNPNEVDDLLNLLRDTTDIVLDFVEGYNDLPRWKRYFVSWENERKILSDKILDSMPDW